MLDNTACGWTLCNIKENIIGFMYVLEKEKTEIGFAQLNIVSYEAAVSFFSFWVCLILPVPQTILDNHLNPFLFCCIILHK